MRLTAVGFAILMVLVAATGSEAQGRGGSEYRRDQNGYPTYDSPDTYQGYTERQAPRDNYAPKFRNDPSFNNNAAVQGAEFRGGGWQPVYLLSGPAAIFKGVGASVWCIGSMSSELFSGVQDVGQGFTATFLWAPAIVADSVLSTAAYALVGLAHTVTFGFLVQDPPRQIEDIPAPIYCVISGNELNTRG